MRCFIEVAPVTGDVLMVTVEPDDPDAPVINLGADGEWVEDSAFDEPLNPRVREVGESEASGAAAAFGWTPPLPSGRPARGA